MKKLKRYTITGIIFVFITGTIAHFIYGLSGNNFILGFFFPINESTWEHMKLCFFPMLPYSLFMNKKVKSDYPCVTSSLFLGNILGTFFIPVIFYTYSGILGYHLPALDIGTFLISVLFAFAVAYKFSSSKQLGSYTTFLKFLALAITVCFFLFTYHPPKIGIFIDPTG